MGQARISLLTIGRLDKKFLAGGIVILGPHRRTNDPISRDRMGGLRRLRPIHDDSDPKSVICGLSSNTSSRPDRQRTA
jgi:hypothetical protein